MYSILCENFRDYIKEQSNKLYNNEQLLSILEPFYGLCNYNTYDEWRLRSDLRYYETSNLIYRLTEKMDYQKLQNLYAELKDQGYDAYESSDFDEQKLTEQIELILNLIKDECK